MDPSLFDYELTFGVQLNLNKADRLRYAESAMTHAMTITGVDLIDEKPIKWRIENSWGEDSGDKGYLCMTDAWFDEFTYQVVIRKDELDKDILDILEQTPATLPPWVKHLMKLFMYLFFCRIQWVH
jgi:bleomycin hydrolase